MLPLCISIPKTSPKHKIDFKRDYTHTCIHIHTMFHSDLRVLCVKSAFNEYIQSRMLARCGGISLKASIYQAKLGV